MNKTTEALKLATVALKDIACTSQTDDLLWWQICAREALTAIREALAEPVQEPVRLQFPTMLRKMWSGTEVQQWLDEQVQPVKQEPVAWHDKIKGMEVSVDVSTGEDDAHHRVFGRVDSVMLESCGAQEDIILVIEESRNYAAPVSAPEQEPVVDYAYATIKEYEGLVGFSVSEAFRAGWNMARTTNSMLGINTAPAQPVKQEPVAWRVHPFDYGVGHEGAYAMTMRLEQVEAWNRKGWIVESLYAAPVGAEHFLKAIASLREAIEVCRAEALEEAAKVCDDKHDYMCSRAAAAIRGLK